MRPQEIILAAVYFCIGIVVLAAANGIDLIGVSFPAMEDAVANMVTALFQSCPGGNPDKPPGTLCECAVVMLISTVFSTLIWLVVTCIALCMVLHQRLDSTATIWASIRVGLVIHAALYPAILLLQLAFGYKERDCLRLYIGAPTMVVVCFVCLFFVLLHARSRQQQQQRQQQEREQRDRDSAQAARVKAVSDALLAGHAGSGPPRSWTDEDVAEAIAQVRAQRQQEEREFIARNPRPLSGRRIIRRKGSLAQP